MRLKIKISLILYNLYIFLLPVFCRTFSMFAVSFQMIPMCNLSSRLTKKELCTVNISLIVFAPPCPRQRVTFVCRRRHHRSNRQQVKKAKTIRYRSCEETLECRVCRRRWQDTHETGLLGRRISDYDVFSLKWPDFRSGILLQDGHDCY